MEKKVLAFDFGFSSGRAIVFSFDGRKISGEEINRFQNVLVKNGSAQCWDVEYLFGRIDESVKIALKKGISAIGIDTWGVDFAIEKEGAIVAPPVNYRDPSIVGASARTEKIMPFPVLYSKTGIQRMDFNTVNRFRVLDELYPGWREKGGKLLLMADLFAYRLTGVERCELTNASTTSMINAVTHDWDDEVLSAAGIDRALLPGIIRPGETYGYLKPEYTSEKIPVIAVCTHDTASAVAAVPTKSKNFAYISSGTWSLMGTETTRPQTGDLALKCNFTNEIGYGDSVRLLKNIMGLFLLQETRRELNERGEKTEFADLSRRALAVDTDKFIDPDDSAFLPRGPMLCRVDEYLARTGQGAAESDDERIAIIYQSLAFTYKKTLDRLTLVTGEKYDVLHIVGGGTQDELLNRLTSNAIGLPVITGPIEATAVGNAVVQLIAVGAIKDVGQAREIIANSSRLKTFLPEKQAQTQEKYKKYVMITEE